MEGERNPLSIAADRNESTDILVPSGDKKRILVKVENIPQFIVSTRFICQFNIEGRVRQVNAQLLTDTIYCDPMRFQYNGPHPNITASFAVIWDSNKPLDNPSNIHGMSNKKKQKKFQVLQLIYFVLIFSNLSDRVSMPGDGGQLRTMSRTTGAIQVRLVRI